MTADELVIDWLLRGANTYTSGTPETDEARQQLLTLARAVSSTLVDAHPFAPAGDLQQILETYSQDTITIRRHSEGGKTFFEVDLHPSGVRGCGDRVEAALQKAGDCIAEEDAGQPPDQRYKR